MYYFIVFILVFISFYIVYIDSDRFNGSKEASLHFPLKEDVRSALSDRARCRGWSCLGDVHHK